MQLGKTARSSRHRQPREPPVTSLPPSERQTQAASGMCLCAGRRPRSISTCSGASSTVSESIICVSRGHYLGLAQVLARKKKLGRQAPRELMRESLASELSRTLANSRELSRTRVLPAYWPPPMIPCMIPPLESVFLLFRLLRWQKRNLCWAPSRFSPCFSQIMGAVRGPFRQSLAVARAPVMAPVKLCPPREHLSNFTGLPGPYRTDPPCGKYDSQTTTYEPTGQRRMGRYDQLARILSG